MLMAAALVLGAMAVERPRDVWVFRSVLDKRPRMATAALHPDLWVAYDAANCGLYKAWKGDVNFSGSVYTGEHGPQPTIRGDVRFEGPADEPVWSFSSSRVKSVAPRWRGYRIERGQVTFQYEVRLDRNRSVWIRETPEESNGEFVRQFRIEGLPSDGRLQLKLGNRATQATATLDGISVPLAEPLVFARNGVFNLRMDLPETMEATLEEPESEPATVQESPVTEGAALRVYFLGEPLSRMPLLVRGQTPNVNRVISTIDLKSVEDFGGLENYLFAEVTANLVIPESGSYAFRLTSDDGSNLYLNDQLRIEHDGLHSAEPKEGVFSLNAGEIPLRIEYFENEADQVLRLEWKQPGQTAFEVIPPQFLRTPRGEVKVTSPGKKAFRSTLGRSRPGDGSPLPGVHPSFDLATVRPDTFRPRVGGIAFMPDRRMVICNWEPEGGVYVLDGINEKDPADIEVTRFAFGMAEPLGVEVVDGQVYVLQKQELTQLIDHTGDGIADEYRCIADGWGVTSNFHEFAFGLVYHDGHFYGNLAIAIDPGGRSTRPQNRDRGKVIRIAKDGTYRFVASGLRTPNGIGFGPKKEIYLSDNQGDWLPSSKILRLGEGAFFGSQAVDPVAARGQKVTPPVVWLPQGEIGNSPGNPTLVPSGPFAGQLMHGDVTHGGVKRVFLEEFDGIMQGAVFRFTQGLEGGVNRILFGPDGSLFVGGIGSSGNWGQEGKERYGLQRLRFNGKPTFEMKAVRAMRNGMEIEFTEPIAAGVGRDPADFFVRTWRYVPTVEYGGPKVDDQGVPVTSVTISSDRKRAFLEIPNLKPDHVAHLRLSPGLTSEAGRTLWSTEAWYTLNVVPKRTGKVQSSSRPVNELTAAERREGFRLLFDGRSLLDWRGHNRPDLPNAWKVEAGVIAFVPGGQGGDIITKSAFGDFELRLEWKVERGGNSGIFYRVNETPNEPAWFTGAEMQVLDDDRHPDGNSPLTSAGSLYGLVAPSMPITRPAGTWNEVRIVAKGSQIEHWLNGMRIVRYDTNSSEFRALMAKSKFKDLPRFMKANSGHIVLQDHGDRVWYRNLRIRDLK